MYMYLTMLGSVTSHTAGGEVYWMLLNSASRRLCRRATQATSRASTERLRGKTARMRRQGTTKLDTRSTDRRTLRLHGGNLGNWLHNHTLRRYGQILDKLLFKSPNCGVGFGSHFFFERAY